MEYLQPRACWYGVQPLQASGLDTPPVFNIVQSFYKSDISLQSRHDLVASGPSITAAQAQNLRSEQRIFGASCYQYTTSLGTTPECLSIHLGAGSHRNFGAKRLEILQQETWDQEDRVFIQEEADLAETIGCLSGPSPS